MKDLRRMQERLGFALFNVFLLGVGVSLLSEFAVQMPIVVLVVVVVLIGLYFAFGWIARYYEERSRAELIVTQRENPQPRRGLIVFMSPGSRVTPGENAVKAHLVALEHCWVIAGPSRAGQQPTSYENAETLETKYRNARTPAITFYLKLLQDEDDPRKSYHLIQSIYEEAKAIGLSERDIIADYTGGTKSMTAGMILACSTSEDRDAQYVKALQVTSAGTAMPSTQAIPVAIDLKFGGSGGRTKNH